MTPTQVRGSAHSEGLAREVLSQYLTDDGDPRRVIRAGYDHAVRADGRHARADEASVPRSLQYRADSDCAVRTSGSGRSCGGSEGSNK